MPTEHQGAYEIEYSGVKLTGNGEGWVANVTIFGPSCNPMHRHPIFPSQRVLPEQVFHDEKTAEQEALKAAIAMLPHK